MEQRFIVIIAVVALFSLSLGSAVTFAVMQWTRRIPSLAALKVLGIGVYKDVNFTVSVTEIDWGIVEPGEDKSFSAYIKNESNVPITLTMQTEDWSPATASSFIGLSWDYSGTEIPVDASIPVTFLLDVDPATAGFNAFSFTIVIVGSG